MVHRAGPHDSRNSGDTVQYADSLVNTATDGVPGCGKYSLCKSCRQEKKQKMPVEQRETASSIKETSGSSPSASSQSPSSSSHCGTVGDRSPSCPSNPLALTRVFSLPTIKKRARRSDLQASEKARALVHNRVHRSSSEEKPKKRNRPPCNMEGTDVSKRFESPDRHTPLRQPISEASSTLRTSLSPYHLTPRERHFRQRDLAKDPFRSVSESGLHREVRNHIAGNGHGVLAPHYMPSFVHARDPSHPLDYRPAERNIRYVSMNGIWSVGGRLAAVSTQLQGVNTGTGEILTSGTNAPMITAQFLEKATEDSKAKSHQARLALALDIDQARRVLPISPPASPDSNSPMSRYSSFDWRNNAWVREQGSPCKNLSRAHSKATPEKAVPSVAFRVLDAPRLKDDFYCSVLAYCYTNRTLAVALTHRVYLWTEHHGVRYPPLAPSRPANYVSSLAFSSINGGKAILAVARNSGHVTLWSLFEQKARFEVPHPWAACSLAFRPTINHRQMPGSSRLVACEDLLVGDDSGCLYYYSIYWPDFATGYMTLLTKLDAHSQNICGLAWSSDGRTFVSGGNDNAALLFEADAVLEGVTTNENEQDHTPNGMSASLYPMPPQSPDRTDLPSSRPYIAGRHSMIEHFGMSDPVTAALNTLTPPAETSNNERRGRSRERSFSGRVHTGSLTPPTGPRTQPNLQNRLANPGISGRPFMHKKSFYHAAAVKAIAYAPWQSTLLATGGGSNDRQIHFHHTESGSTLAVINVFAQVTSLSWSSTRREIVATFGYAQPEHDIRIAVFAWPSCECVVSIPWERKSNGEIGRALWAISYPGGPNDSTTENQEVSESGFLAWEATRARASDRQEEGQIPIGSQGSQAVRDRERAEREEASAERFPQNSSFSSARTTRWSHRTSMDRPPRRNCNIRNATRGEGETWASRTEEEGSLIIACCDQTVKFFEVWAGKSKGRSKGIGAKAGVLGGSKVLEGWCEGVSVDEITQGDSIR